MLEITTMEKKSGSEQTFVKDMMKPTKNNKKIRIRTHLYDREHQTSEQFQCGEERKTCLGRAAGGGAERLHPRQLQRRRTSQKRLETNVNKLPQNEAS